MTARLTITRDHPNDVPDRPIRLWVDGERWENLRYGRVQTRDIEPGRHLLEVHNTLFGARLEFEAAPGEIVRVRSFNGLTGGGKLMVLLLGGAYLRVRLERLPSEWLGEVT